MSNSAKDGEDLEEDCKTQTIHERDTTFAITPADIARGVHARQGSNSPSRPDLSITAMDVLPEGGQGGTDPENVSKGTGPMGPQFCQATYNMNAPNLQTVTNVINAQHVMIGCGNTMNINTRRRGKDTFTDSEDSDSESEEEVTDLQQEVENRRKKEEQEEKKAMFQETLRSSRPISDQEMRDVSKCLFGAWRKFLRYLEIDDDLMDKYNEEYVNEGGLAEVVYQLLDHWRRNTESPEVQKVARALGKVNMWDTVSDHLHP